MSLHIGAGPTDIAETVLLPGDPLRAKYMAENLLEGATCYNKIRGMLGFTGTYKGKQISIQGTGMGMPSCSIYVHELLAEYKVRNLIRVGSCGSIQEQIELRDVIIAMTASTDSNINTLRFQGKSFAPCASYSLLQAACDAAKARSIPVKVGSILSTDLFYHDDPDYWRLWADHGILALEMETAAIYTLAAKFQANALSILTVSDNLCTGAKATSEERESSFTDMVKIALESLPPASHLCRP
jgi:purine-nucleoside phosphorylase